jgi:hypothetical protein
VAPETIEKDAACTFPRQAWQAGEQSLRFLVIHRSQDIERVLASDFADFGEKTADRPRLLIVEAAVTKNPRDVACRSTLQRVP